MAARRPPPADRQVSAGGRRRQRPRFVPSSGRRRTDRGGTMGQLATGLLSLSGWAALALLFMLPALEAPAFLGLVLPGELALLLGGVLAHQDRIPLVAALAVGVAGAVAGDTAGYWIGRRWGPRLLRSPLGRRVGPARRHTVEGLLLRGGGWAL